LLSPSFVSRCPVFFCSVTLFLPFFPIFFNQISDHFPPPPAPCRIELRLLHVTRDNVPAVFWSDFLDPPSHFPFSFLRAPVGFFSPNSPPFGPSTFYLRRGSHSPTKTLSHPALGLFLGLPPFSRPDHMTKSFFFVFYPFPRS